MMWDFGMMRGWGGWGWFGPFHFIIPLLFWALVITAVVVLVRRTTGWSGRPPWMERHPSGLDILEERYSRGEINRDEYLQKKHDLLG